MLQLHNLKTLKKKNKRIGRGGSRGGTSGRGHKGQRARSGGKSNIKASFEGGQMPLSRRLPRRGFTNIFKKMFYIVSLVDLEKHFNAGEKVTKEVLREKGVVAGRKDLPIKILCNGKITKNLTVVLDACSGSAAKAIKDAGGSFEMINESMARGG